MKTVKITDKNISSSVSRDVIVQFGEMIYNYDEIKSVEIRVNFKDGSNIGFQRSEQVDAFESPSG